MKRRSFITLLGGAAAAWPLAARGQPMPVIGFMSSRSPEDSVNVLAAFRRGLSEGGLIEGKNLAIEVRWARGAYDRLPALAAELVSNKVTVLVTAGGDPSAQAGKAATSTIPIVFISTDPIKSGLVASLNRPGGNATGITIFGGGAVAKRLQLMHDLLPKAAIIAYLMNPNNPNAEIEMSAAQVAARSLGQQMHVLSASNEGEFDAAFAAMVQQRASALVVASDALFLWQRNQLVSLAARHGMPAIYYLREIAVAGGLMTYGNSLPDAYRLVGVYVGRILKGEKPADLPVVQSTKFEFVINLKTANALGLTIPNSMQLLADEVIE